jgi:hypothetical protein
VRCDQLGERAVVSFEFELEIETQDPTFRDASVSSDLGVRVSLPLYS